MADNATQGGSRAKPVIRLRTTTPYGKQEVTVAPFDQANGVGLGRLLILGGFLGEGSILFCVSPTPCIGEYPQEPMV